MSGRRTSPSTTKRVVRNTSRSSSQTTSTMSKRAPINSPKASRKTLNVDTKKKTKEPSTPKVRSAYAGSPGSPIASAVKKKLVPQSKTEKKQVSQVDVNKGHRRRGSVPSVDYNDPNNKIFSPGQYHDHDVELSHHIPDAKVVVPHNNQQKTPPKKVVVQDDEEEDEYEEFDPFLFIKHLPPLSTVIPKGKRQTCIPAKSPSAPPICLALDLDETLVHCSIEPIDNPELIFAVSFNGQDYDVYVRTRPYLKQFLREVSEWFEVIVFTASQQVYADKLLDILDPGRKYIKYRVFRESCVNVDGNYLKDLTVLGREMPKVAIIDNSVQAFGFQLDNGIPIESWFENEQDTELLNLLPFLKQLRLQKDVRPMIRDTFGLTEFVRNLPSH